MQGHRSGGCGGAEVIFVLKIRYRGGDKTAISPAEFKFLGIPVDFLLTANYCTVIIVIYYIMPSLPFPGILEYL